MDEIADRIRTQLEAKKLSNEIEARKAELEALVKKMDDSDIQYTSKIHKLKFFEI